MWEAVTAERRKEAHVSVLLRALRKNHSLPAVCRCHPRKNGSSAHAGLFLLHFALLKSSGVAQKTTALRALLQDKQYFHDDEATQKTKF